MTDFPSHRPGATEIQILILHTISALGECSNMQLIFFMSTSEIMNYFELQNGLYMLRNSGHVYRRRINNDEIYSLTPAGKETLKMFISKGVDSYIRKINELVPKLKDEFKRQRDINAKIIHDGDKEYHVILSINEQNIPRMTIDISLPTGGLADTYKKNWPSKAQYIYDTIINCLGEEE
ncbi:MAG: DUF4364 family protein [Christensenellales bacterium]|nr:DUF4364 family protein [Christensenellaceae bacterium]